MAALCKAQHQWVANNKTINRVSAGMLPMRRKTKHPALLRSGVDICRFSLFGLLRNSPNFFAHTHHRGYATTAYLGLGVYF